MTKRLETIVFFGNERLATGVATDAPTLQALLKAGYQVAAVVSNYQSATSRKTRELEIAKVAKEHNIPLLLPTKPSDITDQLKAYGAEVGVLVAYGKIVPQSIIDIFPKGIVNIHPSLLPKHRGPTPIESVILEGSEETGVSIMQLSAKMDAGPVFTQQKLPLNPTATKQELANQLLDLGGKLLLDTLPGILAGTLQPVTQDESHATYDDLIQKSDGIIDCVHKSAEQIDREVRAFAGWPGSTTRLGTVDVQITKAHAVPSSGTPGDIEVVPETKTIFLYCKTGYLCIERLKPAGKAEMDAESFIAGYKDRV